MRRCAALRFAPAGCRRPALHGRLSNQGRPASSAWQAAPKRTEIESADRPTCRLLPAEAAHSLRRRQAEQRPRRARRKRRHRGGKKPRGPGASAPEGARRGDAGMPAGLQRPGPGRGHSRRQAGAAGISGRDRPHAACAMRGPRGRRALDGMPEKRGARSPAADEGRAARAAFGAAAGRAGRARRAIRTPETPTDGTRGAPRAWLEGIRYARAASEACAALGAGRAARGEAE